mgnify:CR=1 FL=1
MQGLYYHNHIIPKSRQLFFGGNDHRAVQNFINQYFPFDGKIPTICEYGTNCINNQQFQAEVRRELPDTNISISPKIANAQKGRPARCQCAISNKLFKSLDNVYLLSKSHYPHLYRPMYKIEDNSEPEGEGSQFVLNGYESSDEDVDMLNRNTDYSSASGRYSDERELEAEDQDELDNEDQDELDNEDMNQPRHETKGGGKRKKKKTRKRKKKKKKKQKKSRKKRKKTRKKRKKKF